VTQNNTPRNILFLNSWAWWYMFIIQALKDRRQKAQEFNGRLSCIARAGLKKSRNRVSRECSEVIEHLPSMHKALGLILSTTRK
jgi:hypothetical protein